MTPFALIELRELLEPRVVDLEARLVRLGARQVDVDFDGRCAARRGGGVGDQRAQALAERGSLSQPWSRVAVRQAAGAAVAREQLLGERRGTPRRRATSRRRGSTGMPWLGASPRRTLRGITVAKTFSLKNARTSRATCCPRFVRSSCIVSSTPSMSSAGLSARADAAQRGRRGRRGPRGRSTRSAAGSAPRRRRRARSASAGRATAGMSMKM